MEDEEIAVVEVDLYSLLNVPKDANLADIRAAYRRLCIQYHPDKHIDDENKEFANQMFSKVQKAYDVLSDPRKRAVYDLYGVQGLNAGMQVATREANPNEIREEYERIMREREEELSRRRTNAEGRIMMNFNALSLFNDSIPFSEKFEQIELSGMSIMQSVQAPLSPRAVCTFSGDLLTANGNGAGKVEAALRYDVATGRWVEMEIGSGSDSHMSIKGYQTIDPQTFITVEGVMQKDRRNARREVGYGGVITLGRQIVPRTTGFLTWKLGLESSMESSLQNVNDVSVSSGSLSLHSDQIMLAGSYEHKFGKNTRARFMSKIGTNGMLCEYGCEQKITKFNRLGLWLTVGLPQGVVLKTRFTRAGQAFTSAIQISDMPTLGSVLFGTFAPLSIGWITYNYIIEPYLNKANQQNLEKLRQQTMEQTMKAKKDAELSVKLITDSVKAKVQKEEEKQGLIIIRALYGALKSGKPINKNDPNCSIIDVTIAIQNLVNDSQLHLQASPKSGLVGFYDCSVGEDKQLKIQYQFRGKLHEVLLEDDEAVSCPKRSHALK